MAHWIKANGKETIVSPKNGTDFSLNELKEFIGGGYIEIVDISPMLYMVVDEEGLLKRLPYNATASSFYPYSDIVGDVLICKKSEIK